MKRILKGFLKGLFGAALAAAIAVISACGGGGGGSGGSGAAAPAPSSSKSITAYSLVYAGGSAAGTINEAAGTISVTVPFGTNVTSLVAIFTYNGASITAGTGTTQVSGTTINDFTNPLTYSVKAADGSTKNYTVTVGFTANTAKDFLTYTLAYTGGTAIGVVNTVAGTVGVTVPSGTAVTGLVASFVLPSGASASIGGVAQVSGTTANNFTAPVVYTIKAADGSTKNYTVTVTVQLSTAKAITAFSFTSATVSTLINEAAGTIGVSVPFGTNVTALVATFTSTGTSVSVGGVAQTSGTTANNFTNPVNYTVTAADGTTKVYAVTVTVLPNTAKDILSYSFTTPAATGVVDPVAGTVAITVPFGTNVSALVANFTLSTNATAAVGGVAQTSGITANNFTAPVTYTVTAQDGSTKTFTVTVTIAPNTAKAITAFAVGTNVGVINEAAKTITVKVPYGTALTALTPTFTTSGLSVSVGGAIQTSGVSVQNFTAAVIYTVTAQDASTVNYTATVAIGTAGVDWWTQTSPTANALNQAAYNGTNWVAVGALGGGLVSTNGGTTWTAVATTTPNNLNDMVVSGTSNFVAVGDAGTVAKSTTGTTASWSLPASGTTIPLYGVAADPIANVVAVGGKPCLSLFLCGGVTANSAIITSADGGATWTVQAGTPAAILKGVATVGTVWMAVGSGGAVYTSTTAALGTWAQDTTSPTTATLNSVAGYTTGGLLPATTWVAVGASGTIVMKYVPGFLGTPTFTVATSPTTANLTRVIWTGTQFVATSSTGEIITSPSGSVWTLQKSGTANALNGIGWAQALGRLVAVGAAGTVITSP